MSIIKSFINDEKKNGFSSLMNYEKKNIEEKKNVEEKKKFNFR